VPLTTRGPEPIEILEAGPGTGALTVTLVSHLRPGDHLTLCEINADFVRHLERRFAEDPSLAPYRDQVTIHHGPVEDLDASRRFAHIICGLPFNNFSPDVVRHIFDCFEKAVIPGGTINFFEYAAIRRLKSPFVGKSERERLAAVSAILGNLIRRRQRSARLVLLNVPPAWTRSLQY
jgi:phosphatidylethanolamine/phosphatidyl-N-methylethanolamine N-methyltransferase